MKKALDNILDFKNKKEVVLRITKICNQKCLFCFAEIDNKTVIPFENIKEEIDLIINDNKGSKLDFVITGGEPTIHPDFIKILEYIAKKGHKTILQTNALYFGNEGNIEKLNHLLGNVDFFISFHSHLEKIYNTITNTERQFPIILKGIENILKASFGKKNEITINIVINSLNIKFLELYFKYIGENFINLNKDIQLNISLMTNVQKYSNIGILLVKYSEIVDSINRSKDVIEKYDIKIGSNFGGPCDLSFCIGKKLFYYNISEDKLREEKNYTDRIKLDQCKSCRFEKNCSGILKQYIEKFTEKEFIGIN